MQIKHKLVNVTTLLVLVLLVAACAASNNNSGAVTLTPNACVTATPGLAAEAETVTAASGNTGQSQGATGYPSQPTFSPAEQATMQARLGQANPGNPTASADTALLPVCPTPPGYK